MKDKLRICPKCNNAMKYRGNRVWHCNPCHISYHYAVDIQYEKDENGEIKKNILGKPKIKKRGIKENKWRCSR